LGCQEFGKALTGNGLDNAKSGGSPPLGFDEWEGSAFSGQLLVAFSLTEASIIAGVQRSLCLAFALAHTLWMFLSTDTGGHTLFHQSCADHEVVYFALGEA